jgi:glycerol-3-phosphate O-acyltransferase
VLDDHRPGWRAETPGPDDKPAWVNPVVDHLGQEILRRINSASAVTPVSLLATVLLATPRQSMVEQPLVRLLELFSAILRAAPYAEDVTITPFGGAQIIAYGERFGLLVRRRHRLGDVLSLAPQEAVLVTYFRNNVSHLFALPSLVACCFLDRAVLTDERVRTIVRMVYPYVAGELFLRWDAAGVDAEVQRQADALVQLGLLRRDTLDGEPCLVRPADNTPEAVQLWTLAQCMLQTLERFYMTAALVIRHGSGTLRPSQLEDLCHLMAQRMSMLYQLEAPEFFDKALFRGFIARLRKNGVLKTDETGHLVFDEALVRAMEDARVVLGDRLRADILQAMNL